MPEKQPDPFLEAIHDPFNHDKVPTWVPAFAIIVGVFAVILMLAIGLSQ